MYNICMNMSLRLQNNLRNKYLKVVKMEFENSQELDQFFNIGIYPGNEIYVCDYHPSKFVYVIVDNIQYALHEDDAQHIIVEEVLKNENMTNQGTSI